MNLPAVEKLVLSVAEQRVIGSLVEKKITTPDYYPLTLNALTNACNQSSNRDPVMSLDEQTVVRTLDSLREKKLAFVFSGAESRVLKYGHKLHEALDLQPPQLALLCELLLRGPQTLGELRTRTERMHPFASLTEVEAVLQSLADRQPQPLALKLPRQTGYKESRYAHLLGGEPLAEIGALAPKLESATLAVRAENERIAKLEQETESLRSEIAEIKAQFAAFKKQFE